MFKPIILKQKIPNKIWKQSLLFEDYYRLKDYIYTPQNTDNIERYIFEQNFIYVKDLVNNQYVGCINVDAIYRYIQKLQEIKDLHKAKLTPAEKSKIDSVIQHLNRLTEESFIGDFYYPQITIDRTYYRLYYHPIYSLSEKICKNLISKFGFVDNKYSVVKLDVNGALLRTVYQILYRITNRHIYKELYTTTKDIYMHTLTLFSISNYTREQIKEKVIKFINKGKVKDIVDILPNDIVNDIVTYIHQNIYLVRRYMTIYSNKSLQLVQKSICNSSSFFMYVNLDGGVLIVNSKLDVSSLPESIGSVKIECLQ